MKMTSEFSKYADGITYEPHNFEEPTNEIGGIIEESRKNIINAFANTSEESQKDAFFKISQEIDANKDRLRKIILSTQDINAMSEELHNIEIMALDPNSQMAFSTDTIPNNIKKNDILIGNKTISGIITMTPVVNLECSVQENGVQFKFELSFNDDVIDLSSPALTNVDGQLSGTVNAKYNGGSQLLQVNINYDKDSLASYAQSFYQSGCLSTAEIVDFVQISHEITQLENTTIVMNNLIYTISILESGEDNE